MGEAASKWRQAGLGAPLPPLPLRSLLSIGMMKAQLAVYKVEIQAAQHLFASE
jgi:hypothetical protein